MLCRDVHGESCKIAAGAETLESPAPYTNLEPAQQQAAQAKQIPAKLPDASAESAYGEMKGFLKKADVPLKVAKVDIPKEVSKVLMQQDR